jgi:hypothetical protein
MMVTGPLSPDRLPRGHAPQPHPATIPDGGHEDNKRLRPPFKKEEQFMEMAGHMD